jgi:hypothetical protein
MREFDDFCLGVAAMIFSAIASITFGVLVGRAFMSMMS